MPHTPYPSSYYAASANPAPPRPELQGEVETDVCVIGAGYTGQMCIRDSAQFDDGVADRLAGLGPDLFRSRLGKAQRLAHLFFRVDFLHGFTQIE